MLTKTKANTVAFNYSLKSASLRYEYGSLLSNLGLDFYHSSDFQNVKDTHDHGLESLLGCISLLSNSCQCYHATWNSIL